MTSTVSRPTNAAEPDPIQAGSAGRHLPLDKVVFGSAASAVLAFVLWGALAPDPDG